jgi:hypothetical protein
MDLIDKIDHMISESESSYTDKVQGIPKSAFDDFKKYQKALDIKALGFKGFNISKASVSAPALSDKQRAMMLKQLMGDGFDHLKQSKALEKIIPELKKKWSEVQKQAHMETYGEQPSFGSYKVSGVGDSSYSEKHKKQLRTLAHMETAFKYALGGHKKVKK